MGAHNLLAWFFCLGVVLMCTSTRADNEGPTPPLGEYCPPQTYFNSVNCLFGTAPAQTEAFIYAEKFYHTPRPGGQLCGPLTTFEAPNCIFRHVPAGYEPFIYQNGWYVKPNARFLRVVADCPGGTSYDGTGCLYGAPPAGRHASIIQQHTSWVFGFSQYFAFNRNFGKSCGSVLAGSMEGGSGPWSGLGTHLCVFGRVPSTWDGFVRYDRWYISPRLAFNAGPWRVKTLPAEWPLRLATGLPCRRGPSSFGV